jgi:hypothetical protein
VSEKPDESDEVLQAYIETYRLNEDLPASNRKKALYLISDMREMKRMAFPDKAAALKAAALMERRVVEAKVFHACEHDGYNELLHTLDEGVARLPVIIGERFSEASSV